MSDSDAVVTRAQWTWDTDVSPSVVKAYPTLDGAPTKTGLLPQDVRNYVSVPLMYNGPQPTLMSDETILSLIRYNEDLVEQETALRLCQTMVAAPAANSLAEAQSVGIITGPEGQVRGVDYDISEAAYDFIFQDAQDDAWMFKQLRWRPVQTVLDGNAVKKMSYVYPLLNEFFRVPSQWLVVDPDQGMIRVVPATNVQMLPLFTIQISLMGFANSVPGGLWFQYIAGLTPNNYASEYSFIRQLVLARTAAAALTILQEGISFGANSNQITVDGLAYKSDYGKDGAFAGSIRAYQAQAKELMKVARNKVGGPVVRML